MHSPQGWGAFHVFHFKYVHINLWGAFTTSNILTHFIYIPCHDLPAPAQPAQPCLPTMLMRLSVARAAQAQLAATPAPPLNMRHRQMKNIVLERRLSVPPRAQNFRSTFPVDTSFLQVPRRDSTQGLDPRIGLPSLQFLRVKKSGYHSIDNSIGPKIPTNGLRGQLDFKQNRFQTRF